MGMNPLEVRRRVAASMPHEVERSGSVVSFVTDVASVLKVVASVDPVQAGSGDPSPENVRPISGWTGCKVTRTGRNLFNENGEYEYKKYINSSGTKVTATASPFPMLFTQKIPVSPGTTYACSAKSTSNAYIRVYQYTSSDQYIGRTLSSFTTNPSVSVTTDSNVAYIILCPDENTTDIQFEQGSATEYEPFGNTYNITFPAGAGTVYGGTLTVNKDGSGKLVVDRALTTFDEDESWVKNNNYSQYLPVNRTRFPGIDKDGDYGGWKSNLATVMTPRSSSLMDDNTICLNGGRTNLLVKIGATSVDELKAILEVTPMQIVYTITPVSYFLTPGQVKALKTGLNNIWADTGNVTISNIWEH